MSQKPTTEQRIINEGIGYEDAASLVASICRALAHRGNGGPVAVTFDGIVACLRLRGVTLIPRRLCDFAELAGFPVWSSAPDDAMRPV